MINDSFDLEKKAQSEYRMSTKPNTSPGNYHDAKMTQNLERIRSKRSNYKQKDPTTGERKKNIFILDDCVVKYAEGWKLSKNIDRQHKVCVRSFFSAKVNFMKDYVKPTLQKTIWIM